MKEDKRGSSKEFKNSQKIIKITIVHPYDNYIKCKWTKLCKQNTWEWLDKNQDLTGCCLQDIHGQFEDAHKLKVTGSEKLFHAKSFPY